MKAPFYKGESLRAGLGPAPTNGTVPSQRAAQCAAPTKEEERGSRPQAAKFSHKKRNNGAPSRRALQKKDTPKEDTLWRRRW